VYDLNSGHPSNQPIVASVIGTILFLSGRAMLSPFRDRLQNVYDRLRTRIYTEQISASLQFGRGLDSCVFRQPVYVRAFLRHDLTVNTHASWERLSQRPTREYQAEFRQRRRPR
jgi:hypothetical protein